MDYDRREIQKFEIMCRKHGAGECIKLCLKCHEHGVKNFNHLLDQYSYIYDLKDKIRKILSTTDNHSEAVNEIKAVIGVE